MSGISLSELAALGLGDRESRIREADGGLWVGKIDQAVQAAVETGLPRSCAGGPDQSAEPRRMVASGAAQHPTNHAEAAAAGGKPARLCDRVVSAIAFLIAEPPGAAVKTRYFWPTDNGSDPGLGDIPGMTNPGLLVDLIWSVACENRIEWVNCTSDTSGQIPDQPRSDQGSDSTDSCGAGRETAAQAFESLLTRASPALEGIVRSHGCPDDLVDAVVNSIWARLHAHYWSSNAPMRYSGQARITTLAWTYARYITKEIRKELQDPDGESDTLTDTLPDRSIPPPPDSARGQALIDCVAEYFHSRVRETTDPDAVLKQARNHTIYLLHRVYGVPQNQIDSVMLPAGAQLPGKSQLSDIILRIDRAIAACLERKGFAPPGS